MESPKPLSGNESGLIVFDIDDTLLKANAKDFHIYKKVDGKEIALTTDEFAKDPDAEDPEKLHKLFDYRDFGTPEKVYNSIITGTPLLRNLRIPFLRDLSGCYVLPQDQLNGGLAGFRALSPGLRSGFQPVCPNSVHVLFLHHRVDFAERVFQCV